MGWRLQISAVLPVKDTLGVHWALDLLGLKLVEIDMVEKCLSGIETSYLMTTAGSSLASMYFEPKTPRKEG
jgi:hypothetical protein